MPEVSCLLRWVVNHRALVLLSQPCRFAVGADLLGAGEKELCYYQLPSSIRKQLLSVTVRHVFEHDWHRQESSSLTEAPTGLGCGVAPVGVGAASRPLRPA